MVAIAEVNDIVYQCLDECYEARDPEQALGAFVDRLHHEHDWTASEIDEVEATARLLLAGYIDRRQSLKPR